MSSIFGTMDAFGEQKHTPLSMLINAVLTLSHESAEVERGVLL